MDYTIVELEEQQLIGIGTRTSENDPDVGAQIGALWQKWMSEGIAMQVPAPVLAPYPCYGAYYNYDLSNNGYDALVGSASMSNSVPENMTSVVVPAGTYAKFSIKGDVVAAVQDAWEKIWRMQDLPRAFTVDFEAYAPGEDMQNADIDIYVALI